MKKDLEIVEQLEADTIVIRNIGGDIKIVQDTDVIVIEKSRILQVINALRSLN